jgi:cytochrome c
LGWLKTAIKTRSFHMKRTTWMMATALVGWTFIAAAPVQAAVDAEAARALAKGNDCLKCHAIDKDKKGPSLQKIAAKYKGKADGQEKAIKGMTEGKKVKLSDGSEEDHKKIDTKDPKELKNLADWILAQ